MGKRTAWAVIGLYVGMQRVSGSFLKKGHLNRDEKHEMLRLERSWKRSEEEYLGKGKSIV